MSAYVYCRVSTDDQTNNYSLPDQERLCVEYVRKSGLHLTGVWKEDYSGTSPDRPEINNILDLIKHGDVLVCLSIDRFARTSYAHVTLKHMIEKRGARIEYVMYSFEGVAGELYESMLVSFASFERSNMLDRTRRGKSQRVRSGKVLPSGSRALYGYRYNSGTGMLDIQEDEAVIVRLVFDWYVNHKIGSRVIANKLTDMGVLTVLDKLPLGDKPIKLKKAGEWTANQVLALVKNKTYAGVYRWGSIEIPCPAIIDYDSWEKAQQQTTHNTNFSKRNTQNDYLLRSLIRCSCCNYTMSSFNIKSKGLSYYRCGYNHFARKPECSSYIRADKFDLFIWDCVKTSLLEPELILTALRHRVMEQEALQARDIEIRQALTASIDKKRAQMGKLLDLFLTDSIAKEVLEQRAETLRREIEALENSMPAPIELLAVSEDQILAVCADVAANIEYLNFNEKRFILEMLRVKVIIDRQNSTATVEGILPTITTPVSFGSGLS